MFERNYIQKIAYDNIRKQKKLYRFLFISLLFVFILSTMMSVLFSSYEQISYRERYQRYGIWSLAIHQPHDETVNQFKEENDIGYIYELGNVSYQGKDVGALSSLDEYAQSLTSLVIKEGRMPCNENEIALEEEQFLKMNLDLKVNQTIEMMVSDQGNDIKKSYAIVGIIENYSSRYPFAVGHILTTGLTSNEKIALIYNKDTLSLWNYTLNLDAKDDIQYNDKTYHYYQREHTMSFYELPQVTTYHYFILFIAFVGVLGTMVSSIAKRTEIFVLMRSIGATSKQIQKMVIYEGMVLIVIAFLVGTMIGFFVSLLVLFGYAQYMSSSFFVTIDSFLVKQLVLSWIACFAGVFIPSLEAYFVPMSGKIQTKVKKHRVRKVRRPHIFRFIMRECLDHKFVSFLLASVVVIGVIGGDLLRLSLDTYNHRLERMNGEEYDHYVNIENNCLPQDSIDEITRLGGNHSQVFHMQEVLMTWEGIEKTSEFSQSRRYHQIFDAPSDGLFESGCLMYFENENDGIEMLKRHHFKGRYPQKEGEVLLIKPEMRITHNGGRAVSLTAVKNDFVEASETVVYDQGLEIGDYISFSQGGENQFGNNVLPIKDSFEIVGVVSFDEATETERRLFEYFGYTLMTTQSTYQKYADRDYKQICMMKSSYQDMNLKKLIYRIQGEYPELEYNDIYTQMQLLKIQSQEDVLKDGSYFGILLIGMMTLVYLHRKIKLLATKAEVVLLRAIGMTKKQIYTIHLGYAFIIYGLSLMIILLGKIFIYFQHEVHYTPFLSFINSTFKEMSNPVTIATLVILGVCFMMIMFIPTYIAFKEDGFKIISKD